MRISAGTNTNRKVSRRVYRLALLSQSLLSAVPDVGSGVEYDDLRYPLVTDNYSKVLLFVLSC